MVGLETVRTRVSTSWTGWWQPTWRPGATTWPPPTLSPSLTPGLTLRTRGRRWRMFRRLLCQKVSWGHFLTCLDNECLGKDYDNNHQLTSIISRLAQLYHQCFGKNSTQQRYRNDSWGNITFWSYSSLRWMFLCLISVFCVKDNLHSLIATWKE